MPINVILKVFGTIKMPASICFYFWKGCTLLRYSWWGFSWRHERRLKRRQRLSEHCGHGYYMHNESRAYMTETSSSNFVNGQSCINPGTVQGLPAVSQFLLRHYFKNYTARTRFCIQGRFLIGSEPKELRLSHHFIGLVFSRSPTGWSVCGMRMGPSII